MKLFASLFSLAALVASAYSQQEEPGIPCDLTGGALLEGYGCSCLSSFTGDDCSVPEILPKGCSLASVDALAVKEVAELMTPQWTPDKRLEVTLTSPATQARYFNSISFLPDWVAGCSYPGSFEKGFNNETCKDEFTGLFDFPFLLNDCGFESVEGEPGYNTYQGAIHVSVHDSLAPLRGHQIFRTTKASHQIQLSFPNSVNFTVDNLQVLSAIDVQAAVTFQEYDPASNLFTIQLTSAVQWPYLLIADDSLNVGDYGVSVGNVEGECDNTDGSDCLQISTITFNPNDCGPILRSITVNWTPDCRIDCGGFSEPQSATFTIDIPDLCPKVDITASLTGNMKSYSDDGRQNAAQIFVSQQTLYFTITVEASVVIELVTLHYLAVVVNGVRHELVVETSPTGLGSQASFVFGVDPPTEQVTFQFKALPDIFSGSDVTLFSVEAAADVTYRTTLGGRKRDVIQSSIEVASSLVFDGTKSAAQ